MAKETLENSSYCRNVLLVSVFSTGCSLGYALTCLNPLVPVLSTLYNQTYYNRYGESLSNDRWTLLLSLTMSFLMGGGLFGAISVRFIYKALSRRNTMILFHIIHICGILIIVLGGGISGSYEAFIIGRFAMGFAIGLGMNAVAVYIAEISVHQKQATYQSLVGVCICIGNIFGPIFSHPKLFGNIRLWPGAVCVSLLPSLTYVICAYWIPETPFSILRTCDQEAARKFMKKLRSGSEEQLTLDIKKMRNELSGCKTATSRGENNSKIEKFVTLKGVLKIKQYRRQFLTVILLYSGALLGGINHILFFSDRIFINAGIPADQVTYATIGIFATETIAALIGMRIMAAYGSRKLLLGSQILILVSHVITTISLATQHLSQYASYVSILGAFLTIIGYMGGPNLAIYALAGELTIEPTRPTILNYGGGVLSFIGWFAGFIPPYLEISMGPYAFLLWAGFVIVFIVLIYFYVPQTKGKSVAEIQSFFLN